MVMEAHIDKRTCPCKTLPWALSAFTAAEFGDVHSLVRKGTNLIHKQDSAGYTPLHIAAQHNHVAATSLLLQLGADVNGQGGEIENTTTTTGNDPPPNGNRRATPLHRAAFAGATATMSLLLQVPTCDIMAQDQSFGDLKTPLHKAAAGGRYMAIQLLVQELAQRNLLAVALAAMDSTHQTPLQVAQDYSLRQEQERSSVARWDEVAGGPADWEKCVALLQAAEVDLGHGSSSSSSSSSSSTSVQELPPPPLYLSTTTTNTMDGCLDCKESNGSMCLTASWQEAFQAALGSAVNQVVVAELPAGREPQTIHSGATTPLTHVTGTSSHDEPCIINDNDYSYHQSETRQQSKIAPLALCSSCGQGVVSLYQSPNGRLVCKSCHRRKR